MNDLTVISPPAGEALSLAAAKEYLRIGHDGEDELVTSLIASARAQLETVSGLALVSRELQVRLGAWPDALTRRGFALRPGPVQELVSVEVLDAGGQAELVTGRFLMECGRLYLRRFQTLPVVPEGGAVAVRFRAGFGEASEVPEDLVLALKRLVLAAYQRSDDAGLPLQLDAVLAARRAVRL